MSVTLEEAQRDPDKYQVDDSGLIINRETGKIAGNPGGGKYGMTADRSLEIHRLRKEQGIRSKMRGLALAAGIEIPDDITDEQLIAGAGNALEALTAHMAKTFLGSKNLRGMGETFGRLAEPFAEGPRATVENGSLNAMETLTSLALEYVRQKRQENGEVVEGTLSPEGSRAALLKPS